MKLHPTFQVKDFKKSFQDGSRKSKLKQTIYQGQSISLRNYRCQFKEWICMRKKSKKKVNRSETTHYQGYQNWFWDHKHLQPYLWSFRLWNWSMKICWMRLKASRENKITEDRNWQSIVHRTATFTLDQKGSAFQFTQRLKDWTWQISNDLLVYLFWITSSNFIIICIAWVKDKIRMWFKYEKLTISNTFTLKK